MDALDSVLKIEERLVAKATQYGLPIGGTFELLPLCNMNCDMCYIRLNREEMNQRGRLRTVQEWLELAKELKQAGTLFILLTGGEPFLYPYFKELYRGLKELGMIITINTNGTLINEEMAQFLSQDKPRRINVTLYGASNETYEKLCHYPNGYDKTIEGIQLLKKYHLDIKLNGTLVPENQHEVDEMIAFAKEMDLYLKIDTYMFPCSRKKIHPFKQSARLSAIDAAKHSVAIKKKMDSKEYQDYQKYMLDKSHYISQNDDCSLNCRAGKSSFWITWDGYLTPCVFMDEPAIDVFSQPFLVSWEELKEKAKTLHLPVSCQNCSKRGICQVCGACAYCENGNFDEQPHYMCEYIETILEELEKDDEKINEFILRNMVDEFVLIPVGKTTEKFNGLMTLTETGAFIYEHIEEAESFEALIEMITSEYEVEKEEAMQDAFLFINQMLRLGIIELTDKEKNW